MMYRNFRSGVSEITEKLPFNSSHLSPVRLLICEKETRSNALIILAVGLWQVT